MSYEIKYYREAIIWGKERYAREQALVVHWKLYFICIYLTIHFEIQKQI